MYERCSSRLKCNKIGTADAILSETGERNRNNVFRLKQTTKKGTA